MGIASAPYLARRGAQKERVRILYRQALKDTLNWAVHHHLFYPDEDLETIDRMMAAAEASSEKWRHPESPFESSTPANSKPADSCTTLK